MTDKKLTDSEIVKALECCIKSSHFGECFKNDCPLVSEQGCKVGKETLYPYALDLINRLQAENERLQETIDEQDIEIARLYKEIDRWINAYEQVAWKRDIFAEDMKEEIKKDCSYLMLDIKTIKAEAYKEFAERLKETFPEIDWLRSTKRISEDIDNLLKELVGDT